MSEGGALFKSLLNQLEDVYKSDISGRPSPYVLCDEIHIELRNFVEDERTKVMTLQSRVESLKRDKRTLKQQTDRSCDLINW